MILHSGSARRAVMAGVGIAGVVGLALTGTATAWAATATTDVVRSVDLVTVPYGANPGPGQFAVENQGNTNGGGVGIVTGPGQPPLGAGSLQMSVATTADHWSVYTNDWAGTPLSAITGLSYAEYTNNTTTAPTLQVVIDPGAPSKAGSTAGCPTSHYSTLNFEPYLNTAQHTVIPDTWQTWNVTAGNGVVWGTHIGSCAPEAYSGIDWAKLVSYYPDATVTSVGNGGGVGLNVGGSWNAMTGAADALTVSTANRAVTYNFEPGPTRTTLSTSAGLLGPFTATLTQTSTGAPAVGQKVTFSGSFGPICSALTNSSGVASCSGGLFTPLYVLTGYTATFAGDAGYLPSTARG